MQAILLLLAAVAVVSATAWLASRWTSAQGTRVGQEHLKQVAALTGGELVPAGLLGSPCVALEREGVRSRILLDQQAGATVVRRTTQFHLEAPGRQPFEDVGIVTVGNSEPFVFVTPGGNPIGPLPPGWPKGVVAHSEYVVPALRAMREEGVVELVSELRERAGLARWELLLSGPGLRFAIDGFLLEEGAILDLHAVLWRFMVGRRELDAVDGRS